MEKDTLQNVLVPTINT